MTPRDMGREAARAELVRADVARQALEAVLLFHSGREWDGDARAKWRELTGSSEATTKVLCDCVRKAMKHG